MTLDERKGVFEKIDSLVRRKFFDPKFNGRDWSLLVQKHRDPILSANDDGTFEKEVNSLLAELGTSHTSFFNKNTPIPGRNSINATLKSSETADGLRWVFQDVQPGGPADRAGVKPGDMLVTVNEREFRPPQKPEFRMDSLAPVTLIHHNGVPKEVKLELKTPKAKYSDVPMRSLRVFCLSRSNRGSDISR